MQQFAKYMSIEFICKGLSGWMAFVSVMLAFFVNNNPNSKFFRIGPHSDLTIFGIAIDTGLRYSVVLAYTAVSTIVRTLQQEVLRPWIIQKVQNDSEKNEHVREMAYPAVTVETLFIWFDWFMYLNILLAQVDLMAVEMAGNVAMTILTTTIYLGSTPRTPRIQIDTSASKQSSLECLTSETTPLNV